MDEPAKRTYQLRELAKQLMLLEGHLRNFQPNQGEQICCHCSQKHTFTIEALAEESLNILPELAPNLQRLADWARNNQAFFSVCQMDQADATRLLQESRAFRLPLMEALDRQEKGGPAVRQPVQDAILHAHGYNPSLLDGEDELLIHAIPEGMGLGAVVIDREKALANPCVRFRTAGGKELVFAKGAIGALTPEEQRELCVKGYVEPKEASQAHVTARVEVFRAASQECRQAVRGIPNAALRVQAYVNCMRARLAGKPYNAQEIGHATTIAIGEAAEAAERIEHAPPHRAPRVSAEIPEAELRRQELDALTRMAREARILERYNTTLGSRLATVQVENGKVKLRIRGTRDKKVPNEWGDDYPVEERDINRIRAKAVEKFLAGGKDVLPLE